METPGAVGEDTLLMLYGQGACRDALEEILQDHRTLPPRAEVAYGCEESVARLAAEAVASASPTSIEREIPAAAAVMKSGAGIIVAERRSS
eukprot:11901088-Prorocentrum_lima.AAC.1